MLNIIKFLFIQKFRVFFVHVFFFFFFFFAIYKYQSIHLNADLSVISVSRQLIVSYLAGSNGTTDGGSVLR